jgi:2-alkyl-3-oxoalkanoate reductase
MRVLILGGGFVGGHLAARLVAAGAVPVCASRSAAAVRPMPGIVARACDATDPAAVAALVAEADAVVNCVGGTPETILAAARALAAAPPRRIVHLSSMAVYGAATGRVAEATLPENPLTPYAAAKRASEAALYDRAGERLIILRPGCIYGPGSRQWTDRIGRLLQQGRIGDLGPAGDGWANLVHVEDVVAAIMAALRPELPGVAVFNLTAPDMPRWNAYFVRFGCLIGATPVPRIGAFQWRLEQMLAPPLAVAARLGLPAPEPVTPSLVRLWRQDIRLDASRASAALGLRWTKLEAGMADAAAWFRSLRRPVRLRVAAGYNGIEAPQTALKPAVQSDSRRTERTKTALCP